MARILVTGANGYIGSQVVRYFAEHTSHEILAVDFQNTRIPAGVTFISEDILSSCHDTDLYDRLGRPDALVHLAWKDGFQHNSAAHLTYLPHHFAFIENLLLHGVHNITAMGTVHEVGYYEGEISDVNPPAEHPMSFYGIAKNALRQALFVLAAAHPQVSLKWLRAFYITGEDASSHSIFSKILQWEQEGKSSFPFTDGTACFDFIDVYTLARMISCAAMVQRPCEIINVCSGRPVPLKDKIEQFIAEHHLQIRPEYGAFAKRSYDSPIVYGNNSKIQTILQENSYGR